jgi:DtxR family Mn-dependent transcriptional regulator
MIYLIILIIIVLAILVFFISKSIVNKRLKNEKIELENALKHIYNSNKEQTPATFNSLKGQTELSEKKVLGIIDKLIDKELIVRKINEFFLTKSGKTYALKIIRKHRLWEKYLAEETGLSYEKWHEQAEEKEHFMTDEEQAAIEKKLGYPLRDPHGDPIPDEKGNYFELNGVQLSEIREKGKYKIIHVEDEPPAIYQQILKLGLFPKMMIEVDDISSSEILALTQDGVKRIPKNVAINLTVQEIEDELPKDVLKLTDIPIGEKCRVVKLSEKLIGPSRRRLLDLGVIPSTVITVRFQNISGNPRAYEIKNTLIALRDDIADLIYVRKFENE